MKQAVLYKKLKDNIVQCQACAHYCVIQDGKTGVCGVRKNIGRELFLLVYGKPVALNIDPIEKKPLYHFLPGTEVLSLGTFGCNFRCDFCQNWDISQKSKCKNQNEKLWFEKSLENIQDRPAEDIVAIAVKDNFPSISYTYNEPAIFVEYARDIMALARERGIKNVYVSNGFESREAVEYIGPYLDAINIDLKSFSDGFYQKICGGRLQPVLNTIKRVKEKNIWQEITTLLIPEENDSEAELRQITGFIASVDKNIPWHLSRFHPDYKMLDKDVTSYQSLVRARELGLEAGLKYVYVGNVSEWEFEQTYCSNCGEAVIERGYMFVKKNHLKNGKCPKCGEKVEGVWV